MAGMAVMQVCSAGGPKGKQTQREALQGGPDIVIGTPGRLSELMQAGLLKLDRCQALVLDEVDILTGEASLFREQVSRRPLHAASRQQEFCSLREFPTLTQACACPAGRTFSPGAKSQPASYFSDS